VPPHHALFFFTELNSARRRDGHGAHRRGAGRAARSHVPVGGPRDDLSDETARLFAGLAGRLRRAEVDTIVMFDSDHPNTFFLDNWPTFAVGVAEHATGPNDGTPGLDPVTLTVPVELGGHVREVALDSGFDVSLTQEFTVDHSILVPLHFLRTEADILPVFVNGLPPPVGPVRPGRRHLRHPDARRRLSARCRGPSGHHRDRFPAPCAARRSRS
jgi:Catalytic LigB subunit of aromatic ring-opening dioxygenase